MLLSYPSYSISHSVFTLFFLGNITCLEVVLAFQRRSCHFLIHVYAPTYALVVLSWIHFWVKPEEGAARVLPGLAALVLLAVFHRDNQDGLPQVSYAKVI